MDVTLQQVESEKKDRWRRRWLPHRGRQAQLHPHFPQSHYLGPTQQQGCVEWCCSLSPRAQKQNVWRGRNVTVGCFSCRMVIYTTFWSVGFCLLHGKKGSVTVRADIFIKVRSATNQDHIYCSPGTDDKDTVCQVCPNNTYSNTFSAHENCTEHKSCAAAGLQLLLKGAAWHDSVCTSCDEHGSKGERKTERGCRGNAMLMLSSQNKRTLDHLFSKAKH